MSNQRQDTQRSALDKLMQESGLTGETLLYRQTLAEFLSPTDEPGVFRVSANADPTEAVVDVYGEDNVSLALHMGPGLAFTDSSDNEWTTPERVGIEVRLQDVLDQGGLLYPVESVITSRVWYLTLPDGSVTVRKSG